MNQENSDVEEEPEVEVEYVPNNDITPIIVITVITLIVIILIKVLL